MEAYWRKNPKVFQETFEALFPQAESLSPQRRVFPDWFKKQNGDLYKIGMNSGHVLFYTLFDFEKLPCDIELKKIIKVLGNTEFFEKVLSTTVAESVFAHVTGCEEFKTRIEFVPYSYFSGSDFFNMFGRGELQMILTQSFNLKEVLSCSFTFDFEKRNHLTVFEKLLRIP